MQKLFVDFEFDDKIVLDEEQSRHIAKSLRMKKGDMITVCNGNGTDYGCIIDEITKTTVTLSVCYKQASESEPSIKVSLYQGVPKGDKMEDIIQKCVELGIFSITPVLTKRSISRPDEKQAAKKQQRYAKIALEAAQQSGRGIVPEIHTMIDFKKAVSECEADLIILFYEGGGQSLKSLIKDNIKSVAIFIGPEGGFEKEEVEAVLEKGGINATLGKRILRTQTAPVAALTAIMLLTDNME
ncbi:MAG: 16S rRNA (uracil(1498)-N(3))-methyltransferase [Eubacterium sp.]|nr:16S rRNA (uracil(1498)-N(3))-methyltransferase [Eubacterium sp.]